MDFGDCDSRRLLLEVEEDDSVSADDVGLTISPKPQPVTKTMNEFLENIDEPVETGFVIGNLKTTNLTEVKPTKKMRVRNLFVQAGAKDLAGFLDLIDPDHLHYICVLAEKHNTEIFDLPLVRKTKQVTTSGILCPDDKLLLIDAEKFSNFRGIRRSDNNDRNQRPHSVLGAVQSVWKWMKGPQPKKFNSPIIINQYIKKCLFHLNTKNHEFFLWPHDNYDKQTIFLGLDVISSVPQDNGTAYMVDSIHPGFVFMVFLLETAVLGRRVPRGCKFPTLIEVPKTSMERY